MLDPCLRALLRNIQPLLLWREIGEPQFVLLLLAGSLFFFGRRLPKSPALKSALLFGLLALILLGTFAPFCAAQDIKEKGAYFYSLAPLLSACIACLLAALPKRTVVLVGVLSVLAACSQSLRQIQAWEHEYPGHEWAEALIKDASAGDLVLALTEEEVSAVFRHSELVVISPFTGSEPLNASDPAIRRLALNMIKKRFDRGDRVFVTRSFLASTDPGIEALVNALGTQFRATANTGNENYQIFSRP